MGFCAPTIEPIHPLNAHSAAASWGALPTAPPLWHGGRMRPPLLLLAVACAGGDAADSATPADVGPTSGTLRVLTYNVAGLPDGISGADGPLLERMPQINALLDDYDLVGLQEDFDPDGHAALTEGTAHAEVTWFTDKVEPSRVYGAGLSQLLPAAATAYDEEHYAQCNGVFDGASDCLASKGFQVATLTLGGQPLDVYNTHHEAGGGAEDLAARLSQVDQVVASADDRSDGRAILLTGDFNLHPEDAEDAEPLRRYDDAGLLRACDLLGCAEPNHIDQVRLRSSATLTLEALEWQRVTAFVNNDGADLSDHPAIAVTVGWSVE